MKEIIQQSEYPTPDLRDTKTDSCHSDRLAFSILGCLNDPPIPDPNLRNSLSQMLPQVPRTLAL
jgi:hypothetical protein